jgi:hypothetical protein
MSMARVGRSVTAGNRDVECCIKRPLRSAVRLENPLNNGDAGIAEFCAVSVDAP